MINMQMNVILHLKIHEFLIILHILQVISITLIVMKSHSNLCSNWEYKLCVHDAQDCPKLHHQPVQQIVQLHGHVLQGVSRNKKCSCGNIFSRMVCACCCVKTLGDGISHTQALPHKSNGDWERGACMYSLVKGISSCQSITFLYLHRI